ncbi:hypothetical protein BDV59DRAFT_144217 [Aspergillus ambiguus]|uniref:uncharacterized protein n=1 Tax=Aspergillus ambiguus TaxID=176160 RepID=UPI003CCDF8BB
MFDTNRQLLDHNMTSQPIMRWLWPLNLVPHLIDYCQVRAGGYVSASIYNYNKPLTTDGLRLGAYLWRVDDTVDFTPIQFEWAERWNSLKCLKVEMMNIEGETLEEFNERRRQVVDHFSRKDVLHEQIRNAPNLGHNPVEERSDDSTFRLVTYVDAFRIEGNPAAQRLVADIIFAILRYLFHNADSEPRAIALANSIWHSVRVDAISKDSEDELPDDIGDWLFCHPVVVDNPYALLQLDKNRESSFSQLWFIERIMRDGCLWVGHMANSHERAEFENSPEREPADLECSGPSDAKGKAPADHDGTDSAPASSPSHPDRKPETILRRQLIRKTLAMLVGVSSFSQNGDNGVVLDRRNMAAFADLLGHQSGSRKNRGRLERDLVSAFDVDGPCLLAVPYNGEWEMLPRPGFRGMSICWVVEGVSHKDKEDRREDNSGGQLDSDSQMKWPVEGNVLDEEGWISSMEAGTSAEQPKLREENPEPSYRVVNKVQGLWQIMLDVPMQKYTFI